MSKTDMWRILSLELAGDNPLLARQIREGCTCSEIAEAWQNNRRKTEGVGYKLGKK